MNGVLELPSCISTRGFDKLMCLRTNAFVIDTGRLGRSNETVLGRNESIHIVLIIISL